MSRSLSIGLVSVTFRQLTAEEIIRRCVACGLQKIEWGGDIHVPHGDVAKAVMIREETHRNKIEISGYGSYYRLGSSEGQGLFWKSVLETAHVLGAPTIRVWAGTKCSPEVAAVERKAITDDLARICEATATLGLTVTLERHANTLTDTLESAVALLQSVDHPALRICWQPMDHVPASVGVHEIEVLAPWISQAHVFHWVGEPRERLPLSVGREAWSLYIQALAATAGCSALLLEFMPQDDPERLAPEAESLRSLTTGTVI